MRLLHTADWHLCDTLGRVKRTDDLKARVEVVAGLCERHRVDALLIAGDVFSEQASVEQMTEALEHVHKTFADFFGRGGTIVAVTGNHDRDGKVNMVRAGMRLATPGAAGSALSRGRMYLVNGPYLAHLESAGERLQFALVPYPTRHRYGQPDDVYHTREEENRLLQTRVAGWLNGLPTSPSFDTTLPTVLVAHLHWQGAQVHTLYKMSEQDDVILSAGSLPTSWAYTALGHIHKPQALNGMAHVRYSGSLDRLDFGERDNECGAVLVDVGPAGLRGEPAWLPIEPTPFYDITADAAELPALEAKYPGRERAVVRVTVTADDPNSSRDEVGRRLRKLFPRLHDLRWAEAERGGDDRPAFTPRGDFAANVRGYLSGELTGDPEREALLALADEFLSGRDES